MNLLKNIIKKQHSLVEVEILISNISYCKLINRDQDNDLDIMQACTLFYVTLLKRMTAVERNAMTGFFLGLNKVALQKDADYVELSCCTLNPQHLKSRVIIKLMGIPGEKKELHFSHLNKSILHEYILQLFRFTLGNISSVYRQTLISAFLTLSKMDIREDISLEETEATANKTLLCLYHDAA